MKNKIPLTIILAIFGLSMLLFSFCWHNDNKVQIYETGSFTDTRDGRVYKTIKIGDQ